MHDADQRTRLLANICLTAASALRYKIVCAARSCAAKKDTEDNDVRLHQRRCCWAFFFALCKERRVNTLKKISVLSGFVALLFVVTAETAMAQSTIFNIPTTDTVSKGKGYFEFDFLSQAPGTGSTRTYIYNPRLVVGA